VSSIDSAGSAERIVAGRYRLGPVLGAGGMAVVHEARDLHLGRTVAVKLYMPSMDPMARLRFAEEAKTLARLSDPGLVSVYDAGTDNDQPYLVLQLITGTTLREALTAGPLAADDVRALGEQLAATLAYVHANGVIHRDVKPGNVLLDEQFQPYLADFGVSMLLRGSRVTATGQFVGTAGYLAPEQVLGEPVTAAVDVYALGLVLLECLTGRPEYTGTDLEAALARLHRSPAIPEHVPADLAALIGAMTARDPTQRPNAARCAQLLRRPSSAFATTELPVVARAGRERRGTVSLLAAAAAAVLAAAGWAVIGAAHPASPSPVQRLSGPSSTATSPPTPQVLTEVVTVVSTTVVTVPAEAPAPEPAPGAAPEQPGSAPAAAPEQIGSGDAATVSRSDSNGKKGKGKKSAGD
jgi:hypothetical protein